MKKEMLWSKFESKFHSSWHNLIKPFIEGEECDAIYATLKAKAQEGVKIAHTAHNTFKAFTVPLDSIKVVIIGSRPFDGFIDGSPVANGYYLDCSNIGKVSYELKNFYRGIEIELYNGLKLDYKDDIYSLKFLRDQGVLFLTTAMTVGHNEDHDFLWFPFTHYVMKYIIDKLDCPILLLGDVAIPYANFISDDRRVFRAPEPKGVISEWDTQGVFQKIDNQLEEPIMWLNIDCPF